MSPFIFFCGFMGCGKTSLGIQVAALLNRPFFDTDAEIEKSSGRPISELFETVGEKQFRQQESKILSNIITKEGQGVVALGGGTLMDRHNLDLVKASGTLVYIQVPVSILAQRLEQESSKRPLIKGLKAEALEKRIEVLFEQRKEAFEKAHLMVSGISLIPEQLVRILETR